uniref:Beta-glucosidase n=1 Tax=Parascaris univalens TaxID=6257 RepID=A0A915B4G7_PARUN
VRSMAGQSGGIQSANSCYSFPPGFIWSTATAAYQIEGAVSEDGRAASTWDRFVRLHQKIDDGSTGDIACDSYHLYATDVELLKKLGVQQYRFSISWSRVLPSGLIDSVNEKGVEYYRKLIAELKRNGIQPMVTLYHWDLPLALADRGGWLNPQIIGWFGDYARFCFATFGDQVKHFITLNEPWSQITFGYCGKAHAPGGFYENCDWTGYLAAHHFLLAHATAYHIYDSEFRSIQKGSIGITNIGVWFEPETPSDTDAARRALEWQFDWLTRPIFHPDGNYPEEMIEKIAEISRKENRCVSRLPSFTQEQVEFVKGTADFLGLNYYFSLMAREQRPEEDDKDRDVFQTDAGIVETQNLKWKQIGPANSWLRAYPEGFRKLLNHVKTNYNNIAVMITENGCMDTPGEDFNDKTRISYLSEHLQMLSLAINEDHCNVVGYTLWSLMDNFEWSSGYTFRFGIYHVDFDDPKRKRTPKKSAEWFMETIAHNAVVVK